MACIALIKGITTVTVLNAWSLNDVDDADTHRAFDILS